MRCLCVCLSVCHVRTFCHFVLWLQQIQNSLARAVVKAPKSSHITPILKSLHWLKVNERIEYKLLSLSYKVLTTSQPSYLNPLKTHENRRATRTIIQQ